LSVSNPLVSIIILNYNAGELLLNCVESVFKTDYKNIEVIIVDNASKDQSHKICKEKFDKIKLIENMQNLGYCEGNNVGIRNAGGDFIVILNPDTLVEPDWLTELFLAYEKYGDGLYQPKIVATTDHKILITGGNMIQLFGFGYSRGKGDKDMSQYEKDEEIGYASGTCLFTSSKIMKKLENFDSFLFAYHDDLDLCWRGKLLGIKSYYVHKSIIYHPIEGYSFKWNAFKFFLMERNRLYCLMTHYKRTTFIKILPALILVEIAITWTYMKKGFLGVKIKANLDILKNLKKINRCYNDIQKTRMVSDKKLIKTFTDEIAIPVWVIDRERNDLFNKVLSKLGRLARWTIR
jgi:hypothetical protein